MAKPLSYFSFQPFNGSTMRDRSDDPSHHELRLALQVYESDNKVCHDIFVIDIP